MAYKPLFLLGLLIMPSLAHPQAAATAALLCGESQRGHLANVKELLHLNPKLVNASSNPTGKKGADWTPLTLAAVAGRLEVARYLISQGAKVNLARSNGHTPLFDVVRWANDSPQRVEMLRLLISKGAYVNERIDHGYIPLHWATDPETARTVLDHGALINDRANPSAMTPLSSILAYGFSEIISQGKFQNGLKLVRLLVEKGAHPSLKDKQGHDAFYYAKRLKNRTQRDQIIHVLRQARKRF